MSRPPASTSSAHNPSPTRRPLITRTLSSSASRPLARRPSIPGAGAGLALARAAATLNAVAGAPKTQRTSKTTQKLVLLPTAPQTRPLPIEQEDEGADGEGADGDGWLHGYETDGGVRDTKSVAERMTKAQREAAGYSRLTAYCVAKGLEMKLLASFLKREHNVKPRVFDEAMYVVSRESCFSVTLVPPFCALICKYLTYETSRSYSCS